MKPRVASQTILRSRGGGSETSWAIFLLARLRSALKLRVDVPTILRRLGGGLEASWRRLEGVLEASWRWLGASWKSFLLLGAISGSLSISYRFSAVLMTNVD